MAIRDRRDPENREQECEDDSHASEQERVEIDQPLRPELRATVERIIERNKAGLRYLAEH